MISKNLNLAVKILNQEGIVGFPTETVYGLAGNIFSEKAIRQIYAMKQRPFYNPLIVHIKSMDDLKTIALDIPTIALELAKKFWPGPLTILLKKNTIVPDLVTSGKETVAVRIPNHPVALALLDKLDFPLAAPSANPFGMISPTKPQHVDYYFKDKIEMVLDGGICETGVESTIIGFNNAEVIVYRLGGISLEEIITVAGKVTVFNKNETTPQAPGMLSKHYAPKTPLIFTDRSENYFGKFENKEIGLLLFDKTKMNGPNNCVQKILSQNGNLKEAASNFYETLHQLDQMNLDVIIAEHFPDEGLGRVINDKLTRASLNQ